MELTKAQERALKRINKAMHNGDLVADTACMAYCNRGDVVKAAEAAQSICRNISPVWDDITILAGNED